MAENPPNIPFTHVIQKTGLLRSFRIARFITGKELAELKRLTRISTSSKEEYEQRLNEELLKAGQIDPRQSIPGIIFFDNDPKHTEGILKSAKSIAKKIQSLGLSKNQTCFLIINLLKDLGIEQSDFEELDKNLFSTDLEDQEEDDDMDTEDDEE